MSPGRVLRAYWTDMRYEALRMLRNPAFAIPMLCIPAPLYLLTTTMLGKSAADNPQLPDYFFLSFGVLSVMGPAIFGTGAILAPEREAGLLRLRRALPAPAGSYILAKMLMAMFFGAVAMGLMIIAAWLTGSAHFTPLELLAVSATMMAGSVPFCAVGLFVGAYCSGRAAPGVANLIYFPMVYLSGMFIQLPAFLEKWVVVWPAFHVEQVAVAVAGLNKLQYFPPQISLGVLAGVTVLFGGLAMHRLARVG
jgi:ABC-2 type transport system permease protein